MYHVNHSTIYNDDNNDEHELSGGGVRLMMYAKEVTNNVNTIKVIPMLGKDEYTSLVNR